MNDTLKGVLTVAGAIITLAIISVIISRKAQAPAAITAIGGALSSVVSAAVSPASTAGTNGNNGANTFSTPSGGSGSGVEDLLGTVTQGIVNQQVTMVQGALKSTFGF